MNLEHELKPEPGIVGHVNGLFEDPDVDVDKIVAALKGSRRVVVTGKPPRYAYLSDNADCLDLYAFRRPGLPDRRLFSDPLSPLVADLNLAIFHLQRQGAALTTLRTVVRDCSSYGENFKAHSRILKTLEQVLVVVQQCGALRNPRRPRPSKPDGEP